METDREQQIDILVYRDTDRADYAQAVSHLILLQSSLIASFTATQNCSSCCPLETSENEN